MSKTPEATRGKLNRMCKFFRNKKVRIRYEYNDSLGGHNVRKGTIRYDAFEIRGDQGYWAVAFRYKGRDVWSQEFDYTWRFTGLGQLRIPMGGPYCYFSIKRTERWLSGLKHLLGK